MNKKKIQTEYSEKINLINLEQLYLFQNDNLPTNTKKKFSDLNIKPQDLREIIKKNIQKNK